MSPSDPPDSRNEAGSAPPSAPRAFAFSRLSCRIRRRYSSSGDPSAGERGAEVPIIPGSGNFALQFTHSAASTGLMELQIGQNTACMDPVKGCSQRAHACASGWVSAPHSLQ